MPREVVRFDSRDIHGRELYLLSVSDLSEILPLPQRESSHFGLLLALDGRKQVVGNLGNMPEALIKNGLAHLCVWGDDCSRVHDVFDLVSVKLEIESGKEIPVMTTWHEKEDLRKALWYFLYCSHPFEELMDACTTSYVVSVGNPNWSNEIHQSLDDIAALNTWVVGKPAAPR